MASDIAVGLAVLAAVKTEQRFKREAEQRRIEEERRRHELAARIKHIEARRADGLGTILAELAELDRLRTLIAMLISEISAEPTPRLSAFLAWAKEHLAKRERAFRRKRLRMGLQLSICSVRMMTTASRSPDGIRLRTHNQ